MANGRQRRFPGSRQVGAGGAHWPSAGRARQVVGAQPLSTPEKSCGYTARSRPGREAPEGRMRACTAPTTTARLGGATSVRLTTRKRGSPRTSAPHAGRWPDVVAGACRRRPRMEWRSTCPPRGGAADRSRRGDVPRCRACVTKASPAEAGASTAPCFTSMWHRPDIAGGHRTAPARADHRLTHGLQGPGARRARRRRHRQDAVQTPGKAPSLEHGHLG